MTGINDTRYASWTLMAKLLTSAGYPTSRQQVYAWWTRRAKIGFPDRVKVGERMKFVVADVIEWRKHYVPDVGGRPKKDQST